MNELNQTWKGQKSFGNSDICPNEERVNPTSQEKEMVKQNIRTLMKAFHGCRKNCAECKAEEAENYPTAKIKQKEVQHS